jgi:hypothetical protein
MKRLTMLLILPLIALATMGNTQRSLTADCIAAYTVLFGAYSTKPQTPFMRRVYERRGRLCSCFIEDLLQRPEMDATARQWLADTFRIMKSGVWARATARQREMPKRLLPVIPPTSDACTRRIMPRQRQ